MIFKDQYKWMFLTISLILQAGLAHGGDMVVARVGSEPVTRGEVQMFQKETGTASYDEALRIVIDRKLVINWASAQGIEVREESVDNLIDDLAARNQLTREQFEAAIAGQGQSMAAVRESLREQLLMNQGLQAGLADRMQVSEEEIRAAYEENYPSVARNSASHILFTIPDGADSSTAEAALKRANAVMMRIEAGEAFEDLARSESDDASSRESGGSLGTFASGELLKELEEAIASLSPGEVAGPVRTRLGLHIIRLDARSTREPPPLAEVREELVSRLMAGREEAVTGKWLVELREITYIETFTQ
jgi:parvulin-like peptidyl-prolyl isomerase